MFFHDFISPFLYFLIYFSYAADSPSHSFLFPRLIFHEYFPWAFVPSAAFIPELSHCEYPAVLPHLPSLFPEHSQHDHTYQKRLALYSFLLIIYDFLYAYHPSGSPIIVPGSSSISAMLIGSYAPQVTNGGISIGGIDPQTLHQTTHAISAAYIKEMTE